MPTTLSPDEVRQQLERLKGAPRLADFLRDHNVAPSTGYRDADAGILETVCDHNGVRRVPLDAGLRYLTAGGARRVRGAAKQRQQAKEAADGAQLR
jgi:hypothetical protein